MFKVCTADKENSDAQTTVIDEIDGTPGPQVPEIIEEMAGLSKKIREIHLNECPGFEANFTAGLLLL